MARRTYGLLLLAMIVMGGILYSFREAFSERILLGILFLLSMVIVTSVVGISAHTIDPKLKGGLIVYPVLMGVLSALVFLFIVYIVMPIFVPGFLNFYR